MKSKNTDPEVSNSTEKGVENMSKIVTPEGFYSEKEMAEFLGKTVSTLRADHCHRRSRVPPKTKLGRLILYSKTSFEEWLKSKEIKPFDHRVRCETKTIRMVR